MSKASISPASTPAVHIVDDDAGVLAGLDSLFRSIGYETFTFGSAAEFMESGRAQGAGCLVLDIRLPGLSGLDFQDKLASAGITMPVVLMTGHGDIPMTVRGMKAGAVDFLPKPFREQDMLDAVASALERDRAARGDRDEALERKAMADSLTNREWEVMKRVTLGKMNKQIAFELGLSEITIKIHRGNAMRKMGARTLAEAIKIAHQIGLGG